MSLLRKMKKDLLKINAPTREQEVCRALQTIFHDMDVGLTDKEAFNILGWEYETKECKHSIKDLQEKRDSLVLARDASGACCYDEVIFISKKEYTPHLIEALGDDYTLVRGAAVSKWLESIKAQNSCAILPQLVENGAEAV